MEERVVLSAELRDELSAPLDRVQRKVADASASVEKANKKVASSTKSAMDSVVTSTDRAGKGGSAMSRAFDSVTGRVSAVFSGLKSRVAGDGEAIAKRSERAGHDSGSRFGNALKTGLGSILTGAAAYLGFAAIKTLASGAVSAFSELEDSSAAAGVVFGKNMGQIIDQSKTAAGTMGLSSQQVINAANTFGTYGKAAGKTGPQLATFSTDLTRLAADMASFKGTSTEQAIEAVGAALRGETEPIRAYGVMLDDASMRQQAMAMGIISSTKEALTPQQKILAAQALIFKQTADAQGDFARTSSSTANVQKTLAASAQNLQAKMGGVLAPAFTAVRSALIPVVTWADKLLTRMQGNGTVAKFAATVTGLGVSLNAWLSGGGPEGIMGWFRDLGPLLSPLGTVLREAGKVAGDSLKQLGGALGDLLPALVPVATNLVQVGTAIVQDLTPALPVLIPMLLTLVAAVKIWGIYQGILNAILWANPITLWVVAIAALVTGLVLAYQNVGWFKDMVNTAFTWIQQVAANLVSFWNTNLLPALIAVGGFFVTVWQGAQVVVGAVIGFLVGVFNSLVAFWNGVLLPVVMAVGGFFVTIWQNASNTVQTAIAILQVVFGAIGSFLSAVFGPMVGAVAGFFSSMWQGASSKVGGAVSGVQGVFGALADFWNGVLKPAIDVIAGLFSGALSGAMDGIRPVVQWVIDRFTELASFMSGPLQAAADGISGVFQNVASFIQDASNAVGDFLSNPLGGIADAMGIPKNSGGGVYAGGGVVPHFANGGVLAGYAPGRDRIPAMLSPGEGIAVPELVRALGGPPAFMAMNDWASHGRRPGSGPGRAPRPGPGGGGGRAGGGTLVQVNMDVTVVQREDGSLDMDDLRGAIEETVEDIFEGKRRRGY